MFWSVIDFNYTETPNQEIFKVAEFLNKQNCTATNIIVHDVQFSNLPHIYYNELHGCYKNYLFTDLTEKQLNGLGGNVIPEGRVLSNQSQLDEFSSFYYVTSNFGNRFNATLVYNLSDTFVYLVKK